MYIRKVVLVYETDGQSLNDPARMYQSQRLGVRKIYWCPSGYGNN